MFCISCGNKLPASARFCSKCGQALETRDPDATVLGDAPISDDNLETLAPDLPKAPVPTPRPVSPSSRPHSAPASNPTLSTSDAIGGGRFPAGAIIADRYRIVALLGRGGMGEVYRAEDLRLSQVLAIKFLPEALSHDQAALARFHSEVRVARQVSHPNVCRVFDIGEAEGVPFLTMEYVDGEDLSALIRRIGRLPQDKAIEVARQVCAGLAAAHERGVVHRDLKPANVMLDGAGKARITDFGLAGVAAQIQGSEVRAGTPAYMAPEQLAGKEVTFRSDIFSLGLLMFELLTGRRAYDAPTLAELMRIREEGITNPSTILKDLDPLAERVILRCLEKDPAKRPASALQVAAALPGGDPLAAALAAGETPSPEMVAAAGTTEGMQPRLAVACMLCVVLLTAIASYLGFRESGLRQIDPRYSGEVLRHKAAEIRNSLGYTAEPRDRAFGFEYDDDYLTSLSKSGTPENGWNRVLLEDPPVLRFWYRESPQDMMPHGYTSPALTPGVVTFSDPPRTFSGMINLRLDPKGQLLYFQAIPPEREEHPAAEKPVDWRPLFRAAGLNEADLRSARPQWNTLSSSNERAAWDGTWPGTNRPLHVEAAALHGLPVFFQLSGPWTTPGRMLPPEDSASQRWGNIFAVSITLLSIIAAIWLARRNYIRGKGDRRGAWRIAWFVLSLQLALFVSLAHLKFSGNTLFLLAIALSTGLFLSALLWTLYLALEPYVRSKWPQTIVSWSRILTGKLRDPLVGRDILYGTILGLVWVLVLRIAFFLEIRAGDIPQLPQIEVLEGARGALAMWLGNVFGAIVSVLLFFFVLVFLRALVRNRWIAAALFVAIFAVPKILSSNHPAIEGPVFTLVYLIAAFAVVHFGLVALAIAFFSANILLNLPFALDPSQWYVPESTCLMLSVIAVAAWGFYTALAGQRLFKGELFDA